MKPHPTPTGHGATPLILEDPAPTLTFQGMEEVINCMLIEVKCFIILLSIVSICGLLHQVNGFLEQNTTSHNDNSPQAIQCGEENATQAQTVAT